MISIGAIVHLKHHTDNPIHCAEPIPSEHILKALANPVRRQILQWLKTPEQHFEEGHFSLQQGVCVGQIEAKLPLSQSTVSNHLAILEKAQLVTSHKVGQWSFYRRNEVVIEQFLQFLQHDL